MQVPTRQIVRLMKYMCVCCHFGHEHNKKDPFNLNVFANFHELDLCYQQVILNLLSERIFLRSKKVHSNTLPYSQLNWDRRKFISYLKYVFSIFHDSLYVST